MMANKQWVVLAVILAPALLSTTVAEQCGDTGQVLAGTVEKNEAGITAGRLIPYVNLQSVGGLSGSHSLIGVLGWLLLKCPEGVLDPNPVNCPNLADPSALFKVPATAVRVLDSSGVEVAHSPYIQVVASQPGVCLFHHTTLIRRGSAIEVCDDACMASGEGGANDLFCEDDVGIDASDAESRMREAIRRIDESQFGLHAVTAQTAFTGLCDGDAVTEFSINLMSVSIFSTLQLGVIIQGRSNDQRCSGAEAEARRICYDTNRGADVHTAFGDANGFVCVSDFVLEGPVDLGAVSSLSDAGLVAMAGDVMDTGFVANARSAGCAQGMEKVCVPIMQRMCLEPECS